MNAGAMGFPADGSGLIERIGGVVLAAPSSEILFGSLSLDNYQSIQLKFSGRSTGVGTGSTIVKMNFNFDTGNNYEYSRGNRFGSANSAAAAFIDIGDFPLTGAAANRCHTISLEVHHPSSLVWKKTMTGVCHNATDTTFQIISGEWASVLPITSIRFTLASGNFEAGSYAFLYGVKK